MLIQLSAIHSRLVNLFWFPSNISLSRTLVAIGWNLLTSFTAFLQIYYLTCVPEKLIKEVERLKVKLFDFCHWNPTDKKVFAIFFVLYFTNFYFISLSWNFLSYKLFIMSRNFTFVRCLNVTLP